jgi:hypothetical protein
MLNLILSLLACAPSGALSPTDTSADTGTTAIVDSGAIGVPASAFACTDGGANVDIPPDAAAVSAVHLEAADGSIMGETDDWSVGNDRIIVVCGDAAGGEVVWSPGE